MGHVVCRPTRREAEEFFHYFAEELADADGQAYYRRQRGAKVRRRRRADRRGRSRTASPAPPARSYDGAYPGTYPFVGTPDDVADEMARMSAAGFAGASVAFVDYLKEIPYFVPRCCRGSNGSGCGCPWRHEGAHLLRGATSKV